MNVSTKPDFSAQSYKDFLLTTDKESKLSESYGKRMAEEVMRQMSAGDSNNYYSLRNAQFRSNIAWATGKVDIYKRFADWLQFNGKHNFINIRWSAPKLVNRIISGLVGRWMSRIEKIQVTATDPLSVREKQEQYEQAEFVLYNRAQLQQLEQESGVPMMSPDQFVAEDKDDLELWAVAGSKLPEEIKYEMGTNDILQAAGFFDVLKEKLLHDSAECGLVGTYVWMDEFGVIHVEWVKPLNLFSSYSEYNDFRDTAIRGYVKSMKISELRKQYSREFGGKFSEEEIFKIAATSKDYQRFDKLSWNEIWNVSFIRPYDEWNIEVICFWMKSVDEDSYVMTVTKQNSSTIMRRVQQAPQSVADNQEYIKKDKWNLYKGVYARESMTLLEWGLDNNLIRPQDPRESGDVEFPISMYMYQNVDMRNVAIPEKIEEPVEQMILARLKIQQLVAKMKPTGAMINIDAVQEIDLGLAGDGTPIDSKKVYEQTGDLYYRGKDAEGNPIPVPIQELQNSGFIAQLQGLIQLYEYHYKVLKDELGEDPNLITMASQPRVTTDNVQFSQQQSDYATDYIYNAYKDVMQQTAKKVACLLNNSVRFGASAYRHIMQQEDVKDRVFSTKFSLLPNQVEIQEFNNTLNQAIASNPLFSQYVDPFKLRRMAKEDVKLAELYYNNALKRMMRIEEEKARQREEGNAKVQAAAAQQKAESDFRIEKAKANLEIIKEDAKSKAANESEFLKGYFELLKAGVQLPPEMSNLKNLMIRNIEMSVSIETRQMISDAMMEAQEQQASEQQMQPQ